MEAEEVGEPEEAEDEASTRMEWQTSEEDTGGR